MDLTAHERKEARIWKTSFPIFPDSFGKEGIANVHYRKSVFYMIKKICFSYNTLLSLITGGDTIRDFIIRNPNVFEKKYPSTRAGGKPVFSSFDFTNFETLLEA